MLETYQPAQRSAHQAQRAAHMALADLIEIKPYDRTRIEVALADMAEATADLRSKRHLVYSEILDAMNDEERAEVAAMLRWWSKRRRSARHEVRE